MNAVSKEMRDKLRAPLPAEAIKPHPTKTYLSTIKPIYVTERLNDVFGIGAWSTKVELVERGENGTVITKTTFTIPEYGIHYECFGGNDNGGGTSKGFDLGDAFKGSTTDAINKIASYMEIAIDVFKGKSNPPPTNKEVPPKTDNANTKIEKKWLNPGTEQWTNAVTLLKKETPLNIVLEFYRISKANETKLIEESKL